MTLKMYFLCCASTLSAWRRRERWGMSFLVDPGNTYNLLFKVHVCMHAYVHACMHALTLSPWTVACQVPLSMELSKQEFWRGLPLPSPFLPKVRTLKTKVRQITIEESKHKIKANELSSLANYKYLEQISLSRLNLHDKWFIPLYYFVKALWDVVVHVFQIGKLRLEQVHAFKLKWPGSSLPCRAIWLPKLFC